MDKKIPTELLERIKFKKPNNQNPSPDQPIDYIKFDEFPCPDCDKSIRQQLHQIRQYVKPQVHFRTKCENCGLVKDPETGKFTVDFRAANGRFLDYFTKKE